jgi:hypothetical protein
MEKEYQKNIVNNFEPGCNCQVYNAPISGCVFAMPGANITQYPAQSPTDIADDEQDVIDRLKPMFYGDAEIAKAFLQGIQGMKPTQITEKVNQLVGERKISDMSKHRDLWKVLRDCGIYDKSETNWNRQVR